MNVNRPIVNTNSQSAATSQPDGSPKSCYIESVSIADVLHDQLEYLVMHGDQDCPTGCLDCSRLERVRHWLMLPFDSHSA
jgi:hypothetical protein